MVKIYSPAIPEGSIVTTPKKEIKANISSAVKTTVRFYDITATKDGFSPNVITVNKGDTLKVDFKPVDGSYDLDIPYLGAYFKQVPQGETRTLPFDTATPGTYLFSCRDHCPSGGKIKGTLIVLQ